MSRHCRSGNFLRVVLSSTIRLRVFQLLVANGEGNDRNSLVKCGIWLAPSTIPGAGIGMFAGRSFQQGEELLPYGDVMIPVVDYLKHADANEQAYLDFLWTEYVWGSDGVLADREGYHAVDMASPGFGSAANSFIPIYNVDEWYPQKDSTGLHRSRDPGVGAFSAFHDRQSTARFPIAAGEELYVTYSASWFEGRAHFGPIPTGPNFDDAQHLVDRLKEVQAVAGMDIASRMWDQFMKNTVYTESRVIGAFHHSKPTEMDILTQQGMTIEQLRKQESTRPIDWLEKYGTCGDHLKIGKSTIPQAGRGAFAHRTLPKGTKVAQLPMIHLSNRAILTMYNYVNHKSGEKIEYRPSKSAGVMGQQLLLNYCFGHQHSTLLLCPYGPLTNYVNHNQTRANVKIVWGREESGNHIPSYLEKPIEELVVDKTAKLAMELVAIRDIEEGEEVFLDYGDEWEDAWTKHVQTWMPVQGAERYKSATDFNSGSDRLPTIFEQLNGTAMLFPPNVGFTCDSAYSSGWDASTLTHFQQYHVPDYRHCTILSSNILDNGLDAYDVHFYRKEKNDNDSAESESYHDHYIVRGVPRVAIRFFDMPYTHDMHLPNTFRHDIRIPDELFPEVWKNQK